MDPDPAQPAIAPAPRLKAGDESGTVSPSSNRPRVLWRIANAPFLALIWLYRIALGPWMGGHCRFHPSCSTYALEAFRTLNTFHAAWLTTRRLLRCHPWGGSGYDPVPLRTAPQSKHQP